MQQYQQARRPARTTWHSSFFLATMMVISSLIVFGSMTLLASDLAQAQGAHLAASSGLMNAVVYDVTHGRYLTYNARRQFIAASSMKVPIMLTFLDMIERQGREPTNHEMTLLRTMIENSNNDSASALYDGEIGGAAGVTRFMQRIGITGLSPNPNAWGWSLITPLTMVRLLTRLYKGSILTRHDRHLALYLMEHVEADQRIGVGDTAQAGAIVAMKDGWVPAPDGQWAVNSSGIVITAQEVYIIAVYTQENPSLGAGWSVVRQVCRMVDSRLQ
jgi:beta-lactamase class A